MPSIDGVQVRSGENKQDYMKLKQHLEDSNIYFLNPLRREIEHEDQFSRLFMDQKQLEEGTDQTSLPGLSVIMDNNVKASGVGGVSDILERASFI